MRKNKLLMIGLCLLLLFILWTILITHIDVAPIGPLESSVGFSTINKWFHELTGIHLYLYTLSDLLSIIPIGIVMSFAVLGCIQWVQRKSLTRIDKDIWILGGYYLTVAFIFVVFEFLDINYRPILIDGVLEASYPSSTTLLVMCIVPSAMLFLKKRLRNKYLKAVAFSILTLYTAFMVFARLLSGVHWLTDIIGAAILSMGLVVLLYASCNRE